MYSLDQLPPAIRRRIFRHVLEDVNLRLSTSSNNDLQIKYSSNIMQINRLLRSEALYCLSELSTIDLDSPEQLRVLAALLIDRKVLQNPKQLIDFPCIGTNVRLRVLHPLPYLTQDTEADPEGSMCGDLAGEWDAAFRTLKSDARKGLRRVVVDLEDRDMTSPIIRSCLQRLVQLLSTRVYLWTGRKGAVIVEGCSKKRGRGGRTSPYEQITSGIPTRSAH